MGSLRATKTCYIVNESDKTQTLSSTEGLFWFGKGAFKMLKDDDGAAQPASILFQLTDPDTVVMHDNVAMPLIKLLMSKRQASSSAVKLCYHKIAWDVATPEACKIELTHKVAFVPDATEAAKLTVHNFAAKEAPGYWETETTHILWHVRWTVKGLMPIKPVVSLKGDLTLEGNQALAIVPRKTEAYEIEVGLTNAGRKTAA